LLLLLFVAVAAIEIGDMNYRVTFSQEIPSNTKKNIAELNSAMKNAVVTADDVELSIADENGKEKVHGLGDDDSDESDVDDEAELVSAMADSERLSKKAAKKAEQ
jgi:hypothetical protein